jgi:hypothetical protein
MRQVFIGTLRAIATIGLSQRHAESQEAYPRTSRNHLGMDQVHPSAEQLNVKAQSDVPSNLTRRSGLACASIATKESEPTHWAPIAASNLGGCC